MATITADNIASVSLKDADRDPDGFAEKLGKSFEEFGFAIIADHGMPDELIHRAEDKAKAFFALPEAVKRKYKFPAAAASAAIPPSASRPPRARPTRPQGILARRPRPAAGPPLPRPHGRQCLAGAEVPELQGHVRRLYATLRRHGPEGPGGDRRLPRPRRRLFRSTRCATAIRSCALLHYPPVRSRRASTSAPARTRTSTSSPCCSAPRRRGWR